MRPQWKFYVFLLYILGFYFLIQPHNCLEFTSWCDNIFFTLRSYLDLFSEAIIFFYLETVWWAERPGSSWADFTSCFSRSRASKSCEYRNFQYTSVFEPIFVIITWFLCSFCSSSFNYLLRYCGWDITGWDITFSVSYFYFCL